MSDKTNFDRAKKVASNLIGLAFSTNKPERNVTVSVTVNSMVQVHFDHDINLKQHLIPNLRKLFSQLDEIFQKNDDIKSNDVKQLCFEIFSNYGESVSTGFFIGNYELDFHTAMI